MLSNATNQPKSTEIDQFICHFKDNLQLHILYA